MAACENPTLSLDRLQVTVGRDRDARPTVVLSDGDNRVVLGSDQEREAMAGGRRIVEQS